MYVNYVTKCQVTSDNIIPQMLNSLIVLGIIKKLLKEVCAGQS